MRRHRHWLKWLLGRIMPPEMLLVQGDARRVLRTDSDVVLTTVSLTFDDGPHPKWTLPVLDALDEAGWKGTFFLIGREAAAYPGLVREIVARGHEIGNHSYHHAEPAETSSRQLLDGVLQAKRLLGRLTGNDVSLVRPPKGAVGRPKLRALWRSQQTVVLWNVDTKDYKMSCGTEATRWATGYAPCDGDIVLLHDRLPYAAQIVRQLAQANGEGLTSVPVSHWLPTS